MNKFISLSEFAKKVGISRSWAYKLANGGAVKTTLFSGHFFLKEEEAERWASLFKANGKFGTFPRMTRRGLVMRKVKG